MSRLDWLERAWVWVLAVLAALACAGTLMIFWPGYIGLDARYQLQQALGQKPLSDWHPPAMSLLWRLLIWVTGTPASMAALQSVVLWASLFVIAWSVWHLTRRRWSSLLVLAVGITPQVLTGVGVLWKDTPMAFAFLATAAIAVAGPRLRARPDSQRWVLFAVGLVFLVYAVLVRKNAVFAAVPVFAMLVLGLWPRPARRNWLIGAGAIVAGIVLSSLAISVFARPIHTGQLSQVQIDDLINVLSMPELRSAHVSPDLRQHLVHAAEKCHRMKALSNYYWACYGWGAHGPYTAVAHADQIQSLWISQIPHHPLRYARYRVEVFSELLFHTRRVYSIQVVHNHLGLHIAHHRLANMLRSYIRGTDEGLPLLFHGWFWLLLAAVLSILPGRGTFSMHVRTLSLSSLVYIVGYLPILPVGMYRYIYWPALAGTLALVLLWAGRGRTLDLLPRGKATRRPRPEGSRGPDASLAPTNEHEHP